MRYFPRAIIKRGVLALAVAAGLSSCDLFPMPIAEYRFVAEGPTNELNEDFEDNDGLVSNKYYWEGLGDGGTFKLSNSGGNYYIEPKYDEYAAATKVVVDLPARGMLLFDWRFFSCWGGDHFQVNVNGVIHDDSGFYGDSVDSLLNGFMNDFIPLNAGRNAIAFIKAQDLSSFCQIDNVRVVFPIVSGNENFENGDASANHFYHLDTTDVAVVSAKSHTGTHSLKIKENTNVRGHRVILIVESPIPRTMRFWSLNDNAGYVHAGVDGTTLIEAYCINWQEHIVAVPAGMHAIWFWTSNNGSIYIDDISFN